jgi:hypothetical protein
MYGEHFGDKGTVRINFLVSSPQVGCPTRRTETTQAAYLTHHSTEVSIMYVSAREKLILEVGAMRLPDEYFLP